MQSKSKSTTLEPIALLPSREQQLTISRKAPRLRNSKKPAFGRSSSPEVAQGPPPKKEALS